MLNAQWFKRLKPLHFGLVAIVLVGVGLRFVHLDRQEFYHDEAAALTITTGHYPSLLIAEFIKKGPLPAQRVLEYQKLKSDSGFKNSIAQLMRNDPLHPPLYYAINRVWIGVFGDSVFAVRSLSVVISLFTVVAIYFLSLTLFESRQVAILAVLLSAVSPYQFLIATMAREYALWFLLITLSTHFFFKKTWLRYGVFSLLSLYTSLLTLFILAGHAVYGFADKSIFSKRQKTSLLVIIGVLGLLYIPWYLAIAHHWPGLAKMSWMATPMPLTEYLESLAASFYKVFFDIDLRSNSSISKFGLAAVFIIPVFALEFLSIKDLFQDPNAKRFRGFFIIFSIMVFAPTIGWDVVAGGHRGMSPRYHLFFFLFLQLTVIRYLAKNIQSNDRWQTRLATTAIAFLIVSGLVSESRMTQAQTWWNKTYSSNAYDIAAHIEPTEQALIVSSDIYGLIAISRYLNPEAQLAPMFLLQKDFSFHRYKHIYRLIRTPEDETSASNGSLQRPVTAGLWEIQ